MVGSLTREEKLVYDFIVKYFMDNGYAPSRKEIREGTLLSGWIVYSSIDSLVARNLITKVKGRPRSIRLLNYTLKRVSL